jgi:voltage-gated potassium channel
MLELVRKRVLYMAAGLLSTLAAGTAGFMIVERYPWFDALYMALITMTTVGYTEVHALSRAGRIFNTAYILVGVSMMFVAIGVMTTTIIELQLGNYFGKRRIRRMVDKLENHYIICGFGRVGRGAAVELQQAGVQFVIVDRNEDKVERAIRMGMLAVNADSTRDETLRDVNIGGARGVIAALATDADNLFLTLSAKSLNPLVLVSARVAEEENEKKLRRAGADAVFAPYTITGVRLAQTLLRPHVTQFLDFTTTNLGVEVGIEEVQIAANSEFVSKSLRELSLRRELGVVVLAIRRESGEMIFNPTAEAEINAGDYLIVMGQSDSLRKLEKLVTEVRV